MLKLNDVVDENTVIYKIGSMIYTIISDEVINDLKWNVDGEIEFLTLREIKEQVNQSIRVIMDFGLNGYIYEYGNYNDNNWYLYGITKGYA